MAKSKNLNLSKSTLIRSLQCQKSLYLYKNYFKLRDKITPEQKAIFDRGHDIGRLAHKFERFKDKETIDVSPDAPWQFRKAVSDTQSLVTGMIPPVIFEAAFRFDTTLIYLDILEPKDGLWYAWEVKSSRRISETYIRDAAIQYYVITQTGLPLVDFCIYYVREDYDPDIHKAADDVFISRSLLDEIIEMKDFVEETIANAKSTLMCEDVPDIDIGDHCNKPYPCDFKGVCGRQAESNSTSS